MYKKKLYFNFYDLFGKRYASEANRLLSKSQYWSRDELEKYQAQKVYDLITYSREHIPFYKKRIRTAPKENWTYKDMMEYMKDIPILTKKDIQENMAELLDPNADPDFIIHQITGGTTGRPIQFYYDKKKLDYNRVAVQRNFDWAGYFLRKKCLKLTSGYIEVANQSRMKGQIKNLLYNRLAYSGGVLENTAWISEVTNIIKKNKIKVLWGYPSIMFMLARGIDKHTDLGIETIITSSETLQEKQRVKIEETFNCKVFDEYGSREFMVAGECEMHQGLHINEDILYLEVVNDDNNHCLPGENGRILITDFYNKSFPFIRYEIGDEGIIEENHDCACGRKLKRLQTVTGRSSENILINGKYISTVFFSWYFKTVESVEFFQVLVYDNLFFINVILKKGTDEKIIPVIQKQIMEKLNNDIPVIVKQVHHMHRESNGKVISIKKMNTDYQHDQV